MEKEKVLSNLWSLRAGLSVISIQRDKTDKCSTIIEECEQHPTKVDEKLKEKLSQRKRLLEMEKETATRPRFAVWRDFIRPILKAIMWLLLFVIVAFPALAGAGLSIYTLFAEYHKFSVLMFIGGLVGVGISATIYGIFASEMWDSFTSCGEEIKFPRKIEEERTFAIESMIPKYEKEISQLTEQIRNEEELIASAKPTIKRKKEEISLLTNTSTQLYQMLKQQYGTMLDVRDWQHLDLIIFYFETGRADSLKEALQLVDRQVQTDTIVNAIYNACAEICNTIKINTDRLGALMTQGMLALSSQISDLKSVQSSQMQALLDSQTMLLALQKKSNQNSMQLMEDCRYLTTLAEQGEIRRRNNA